MKMQIINGEVIASYKNHLIEEERSRATIEKYMRDIKAFADFVGTQRQISKNLVLEYKSKLMGKYAASSVNSMLAAINGMMAYMCLHDCKVKLLKVQRQFCTTEKELTKEEYFRLLLAAKCRHNERILAIMQTICATGIRVSELQYITAEAMHSGRARVICKGKERFVVITKELQKLLEEYCKIRKITSGCIFITQSGKPMNRSNIWADMKKLCRIARVKNAKVFPHNLRHLFAITFYRIEKDIVHLADILGHSSVETTRIYTATNEREHRSLMSKMKLII